MRSIGKLVRTLMDQEKSNQVFLTPVNGLTDLLNFENYLNLIKLTLKGCAFEKLNVNMLYGYI